MQEIGEEKRGFRGVALQSDRERGADALVLSLVEVVLDRPRAATAEAARSRHFRSISFTAARVSREGIEL